jgi:hypothetical protein
MRLGREASESPVVYYQCLYVLLLNSVSKVSFNNEVHPWVTKLR